ncbi:MAG: hypothetical protein JWP81_5275 [Ferruginibacter sp.]|nr:hypothetical protein [Ferruginibacter sp.]
MLNCQFFKTSNNNYLLNMLIHRLLNESEGVLVRKIISYTDTLRLKQTYKTRD